MSYMGLPQTPSSNSPHLYPQALQLKLYQAFIFSVPILFSIILLLLFYLFYLKRRRESNIITSSPATLTRRFSHQPTALGHLDMPIGEGLKEDVIEKLLLVIFYEDLKDKDSQCCVCLGDFELKEQLNQIPSCKHMFHIDCIHLWLKANHTCPLCRCYIQSTKKLDSGAVAPVGLNYINQPGGAESNGHHQAGSSEQHAISIVDSNGSSSQNVNQVEESTGGRTFTREAGNSQESTSISVCPMDLVLQNSVVIQVEMHTS